MTSAPTLPIGPFEHVALDYAKLRAQGIELLGRLAGTQWTDFNSHDPGVTILEQLCYAITDLANRINYPVPDLLGAGNPDLGLPGPAAILGGDPVTDADLRKLALDVVGVGNAWIEPPSEPELPVYHHASSGELRLWADPGEAELHPLRLQGLARVLVQTSDQLSGDAALQQVAARLHRSRRLGSDLDVVLLGTHEIWVRATIEVGAIEDPVELLAEIRERIDHYLAPPVRFTPLADARGEGRSLDELLDGPLLSRGVTLGQLPPLRRTIYTSDLLHTIMDMPAVRAVRSLELSTSASGPRERWALDVPAGHVASLSSSSELILLRGGLPVRVDARHVRERLDRRRLLASMQAPPSDLRELEPPRGRDRKLARYRSIQLQLPAAYGVGAMGLPDSAPAERKAAARQLEAYLLIFDQLLANAFAQLAQAHELLSPTGGVVRTYFAQPVEDPRLRVHELVRLNPEAHRAWLDAAVDDGRGSLERRKRLLAHLLARFAEQLGDHSLINHALRSSDPDAADRALIEDRQAFLRDYPRHSGARGSGYDLYGEELPRSGLEQRIRAKLGLRDDRRSCLVEHVLLRPIAEDARQLGSEVDPRVPLLSSVDDPDPWSLQLSFVFEDREVDEQLEQLIAQTILEETPAHLRANLRWFGITDGVDHWAAFSATWDQFQVQLRRYRVAKLRSDRIEDEIHLRFRDARDRVIDLLGFGRSYPLRDLPLPRHVIVAPGAPSTIPIEYSQRDVDYELRDRRTGAAITIDGQPVRVRGTGGRIELPTPPIEQDVSYRILASKVDEDGVRREAWLHGAVEVEEGVDPALITQIRAPLLDLRNDAPQPSDARIVDYGAHVEVEVLASQEGVIYELRDAADTERVVSQAPVVGTSGTIVLTTEAITEDIDLRIHGSKALGEPENPEIRAALLVLVLPLRVRADPAIVATLVPAPIVEQGAAAMLRLSDTQTSCSYRVWRRRVRDDEFVYDNATAVLSVDDEGRAVQVLQPSRPHPWADPPGFAPMGPALTGNGGALELPLSDLSEDSVLIVQASKLHALAPTGASEPIPTVPIGSAVQLEQALLLLVRPDRQPGLTIEAELDGTSTRGSLLLRGGQPGVFYTVQPEGGEALAPGYFFRRDEHDASANFGVGQLRIGVDFAIARDPSSPPLNRATTPALPPLIDAEPKPLPLALSVLARRARSGVEAQLDESATIEAAPTIHVEPAAVPVGQQATVVIEASSPSERYRLLWGNEQVGEAVGSGAALELAVGPVIEQTTIVVVIEPLASAPVMITRRVAVTVEVEEP